MANAFNLTAQLNLQGPANITSVVNNIRRQLGNISANVNVVIDPNTNRNITALNSSFQTFNRTLRDTRTVTRDAASAITALGRAINQAANPLNNLNVNLRNNINATAQLAQNLQNTNRACNQAGGAFEAFGRQAGNAIRRAAAFSTVAGLVYKLGNSFNAASKEFIEFNKELVRVAQVTDTNLNNLGSLVKQITELSTSLGVSSSELIKVSSTLAQAGLSAKDTEKALKAVARSALAPSFDSMNDTVEGSIALMRQFGIEAGQLEGALGSINAVSAKFAVEASDLITAIQRTGGVFASASKGVSSGTDALNEFLAIFTSIRATTRESAETIATGLRTIFARIQRSETIENLQRFGVLLTDLEGKFVGPYEAVRRLSEGLSRLDPRDLRFAEIVEELGGFRQIGKVIPLIQQFAVSQQALKVAQSGQASLAKDIAVAQESVANKITKVREEFIALIRSIGESQNFQTFVKLSLDLASALIKLADAAKNVLPAIAAVAAIRSIGPAVQYGRGFIGGLTGRARRNNGGPIAFASGGFVPGQGNSDTVPAMLTPGEFVIRKKAVQALGVENLHKINGYKLGGSVSLSGKQLSQTYRSLRPMVNPDEIYSAQVIPVPIKSQQVLPDMISRKQRYKNIPNWKNFELSVGKKIGLRAAGGNKFLDYPLEPGEAKFLKPDEGYAKDEETGFIKGNNNETMLAKLVGSGQYPLKKTIRAYYPSDIYTFRSRLESRRKNLGGLIQRFADGKSVEKMGRAELIKLAQKYGIRTDYNILGKQNETGENARQQLRQAIQTELNKESRKAVKFLEKAKKKTIAIGGLGGMRESLEVAIPTGKGKQSPATLQIGSLDPVIAKRVQAIIRNGLERLVQSTADVISKSAGIPKTANRKLRRSITAKDIDDGVGFVYERALGLAAGNFDTTNKSIDFPKGIGKKEIADLLGIPSDVPTDITASRDLRGTSLRKATGSREGKLSQFARGLKKQKFANGGLAKTKQKQLGTQDILLSLLKSHPFFIAPQTLIGRVGRQEGIENTLKSIESTYGIKNAKILASGAESVVFDIGKKILKISEKNNVYDLPKISGVAGYTKIKKFGLLTAALQEKLALDKYGTSKDVDLLKRKMKKRGLIWSDAHELNIGYDKKNRPKIIDGSIIRKFANGGSPTDTVPALLTPGEFVINKKAASRIGLARLHELNRADKIQGFAKGGNVQKFATGGQALANIRQSDPTAYSAMFNIIKQSKADFADFIRHLNSLDRPLQEVEAAIIAWTRATNAGADSAEAMSRGMNAASRAATSQGVDLTTRNPSKPQSQLLIVQDFNNAVNKVKQGFSQIPSVLKNFQGSLGSSTSKMMNFSKSIMQNPFSALSKAAIAASNSLYSVAKAGASSATQSIGGSLLSMIGLGGLTTAGNKPGAKFAAGRKAVLARRAGGMGGMGGMGASILGSLVGETIIQGAAGLAGGEKTAAGRNISGVGSSALSYGLLGAQIGSVIPGVGTVVGGIAGGLAGGLAGGAMGYMGAQKQGREYEIQKQQELVDSAVERSTKDISAYAGLEAGSPRATEARKKAIESLTATSKAEEGLLSKTQQEKGFLGFGAESDKDYMQRRIKVEEAGAAQAEQLLSTEMVKTGKTFQELSKTLDPTTFKTLTANIAEADMEYASKRYAFAAQIDKLKSEGKLDEANKLQAVANKDLADLAVTITERKTAEQSAAIEAQRVAEKSRLLSLQMVKLALSLQDATEIMSQSLSRASFEIEDAAKNIGSVISGKQSLTSGGTARDISILENPKAYSEQERRMAGIRSTAVLGQQANYVNRLAEFSTTAKERALSEGNLQFAQRTGDVQLDNQKISNAIRTQLTNSIDETFGNTTIAAGLKSNIQKNIEDALKDVGTTIDPQQLFDQIAGPIIQASEKAEQLRLQSAKLTAQALDYLASSAQELANIELKRADRLNKLNEMRASTGLQLREAMGGKVSARERTSLRLSGVSSRLGLGNRPVTAQTISGLGSQARGEASVLKQQIDQLSPFAATSKQASDQLLKLKTQLAMVNSTIDKTDQALEDLPNLLQDGINDTINEIQQRVSEIESARQAGTSFAEKLVTSTPQELNELNNSFNLMNNTLNGNITTINRSVGANQAYYEALRQGKNAQEAMNDAQTAFANENKNALQLFDELTKIAGVSGPQFDQMKATLLENFAVSQGAGLQNNPFFKEIISQLRTDPAQRAQNDPVVQALRANVQDMQIAQVQAVNEANRVDREAQASLLYNTSEVIKRSFIDVGNRIAQSLQVVTDRLNILAAQKKSKGGLIYASKGTLVNFEPRGTDTVPAMLTPGEFVVNAEATRKHLPLLQSINRKRGSSRPERPQAGRSSQQTARGGKMPTKPMAANPRFANMFFGNRNMINMYQGTTPYQEAFMRNMKGERISAKQVMMERASRVSAIRNQRAGMYNSMMDSRWLSYQQRINANRAMQGGLRPKRYASGGIVGNKSIIQKPNYYDDGAKVTRNSSGGVFNIGIIGGLAATLDTFIDNLKNAVPSTVNVQGKHDVNVIINGASILKSVLEGPVTKIVQQAIRDAFAERSRKNEGS